MAVPTDLTALSTTAASNAPAGSDAIGTDLDNFLRIIQAMLKEAGATLYTATGTNTLTFSTTPTFAAYATGQRFWVKSAAANTGAVTVNINGLGAKSIVKIGTTALVANDIPAASSIFLIVYDGTNFQIANPMTLPTATNSFVTNANATYTVLATDHTILQTTAACVYTLPTASVYPGRTLRLVTQFAGALTSDASNVIPLGSASPGAAIVAATAGKYAVLQSNGSAWYVVEAN